MSPLGSLISRIDIRLGGSPMPDPLAELVDDVTVHSHLRLPDSFAVRLANPGELIDSPDVSVGTDVDIRLAGSPGGTPASVVRGEIVALEPHFETRGSSLTLRGYDYSHRLNRSRLTATYQNMSYADIARKLFSASGVQPGTIDEPAFQPPFVQQTNETAWDFLWRLAGEIDFELVMTGRQVNFRKAGGDDRQAIEVLLGEDLHTFRPRATCVQQVDEVVVRGWDPSSKQAITATASLPTPQTSIGLAHSESAQAFGGGTIAVVDRPVASQAQATALAESIASRLANTFVEGEGTVLGRPDLLGGSLIEVSGVGARFGGTYAVTAATHRVRHHDGYMTSFEISGRSARTLLGGSPQRATRRWARSVVTGVVTNNNDPDALGRIRVQCLQLDDAHEGWWARPTSVSAGSSRGLLMLPQPGDEVLLAFEHDGDEQPFVLGSLWNGTAPPGELAHEDGSCHLASDHAVEIHAAEAITIAAGSDVSVEASGKLVQHSDDAATFTSDADVEITAQAALKASAQSSLELNGATVTLDGSGSVELKSDGALEIKATQVKIEAKAMAQISAPMIQLG